MEGLPSSRSKDDEDVVVSSLGKKQQSRRRSGDSIGVIPPSRRTRTFEESGVVSESSATESNVDMNLSMLNVEEPHHGVGSDQFPVASESLTMDNHNDI